VLSDGVRTCAVGATEDAGRAGAGDVTSRAAVQSASQFGHQRDCCSFEVVLHRGQSHSDLAVCQGLSHDLKDAGPSLRVGDGLCGFPQPIKLSVGRTC